MLLDMLLCFDFEDNKKKQKYFMEYQLSAHPLCKAV